MMRIVVLSRAGCDLFVSGDELIRDWFDNGLVIFLKDFLRNLTDADRLGDLLLDDGPRLTTVWDRVDLKDRLERIDLLGENVECFPAD